MTAKVTFFPVGNGDMALVRLADSDSCSLLIDCKISAAAGDPNDTTPDVGTSLRRRLKTDANMRPYVDVMLLSHPDEDHCLGLERQFWLGPLEDYADDEKPQQEKRIVIRQLWSSPMVFRRASKKLPLCSDARAFNKEARRRVKINEKENFKVGNGDRILIVGEDLDGKSDGLSPILVKAGQQFTGLNGCATSFLTTEILAPIAPQESEVDEEKLSKNNSSVIARFRIKSSEFSATESLFLSGGDAEVGIWERLCDEYSPSKLEYDLLLAPHHCSWHSLSHDSWSDKGEDAEVSERARESLAQARAGAFIVSSSQPILDDDNDPPCIRAKREYRSILGESGIFRCTGEEPTTSNPKFIELLATASGFKLVQTATAGAAATTTSPPRAGRGLQ